MYTPLLVLPVISPAGTFFIISMCRPPAGRYRSTGTAGSRPPAVGRTDGRTDWRGKFPGNYVPAAASGDALECCVGTAARGRRQAVTDMFEKSKLLLFFILELLYLTVLCTTSTACTIVTLATGRSFRIFSKNLLFSRHEDFFDATRDTVSMVLKTELFWTCIT